LQKQGARDRSLFSEHKAPTREQVKNERKAGKYDVAPPPNRIIRPVVFKIADVPERAEAGSESGTTDNEPMAPRLERDQEEDCGKSGDNYGAYDDRRFCRKEQHT
jgi:hypothetical protein